MGCKYALLSLAQHHREREIFPWYNRTFRRVARIWPSSSGGILSPVVWTSAGLLETWDEVFTFPVSSGDAPVPISSTHLMWSHVEILAKDGRT